MYKGFIVGATLLCTYINIKRCFFLGSCSSSREIIAHWVLGSVSYIASTTRFILPSGPGKWRIKASQLGARLVSLLKETQNTMTFEMRLSLPFSPNSELNQY